jgi:hypothetical protein
VGEGEDKEKILTLKNISIRRIGAKNDFSKALI